MAIVKYIASCGYKMRTLVAFSGEVTDPDSGPDGFTETSKTLNPNLRAKLDAAGHYDDFEVDRVVAVVMKQDARQGELVAAVSMTRRKPTAPRSSRK